MEHIVTLIPGDGVGPEIAQAARRVLEASGVPLHWEVVQAGEGAMREYRTPLPDHVLASIRKNKVALKGPLTTPVGTGFRSANVALRQELDLYACLRPCKSYPGIPSPYQEVDIVVVRENTEDLYRGIEFEKGAPETARLIRLIEETSRHRLSADSGISIKPISERASRRITRFAFEYARSQGRKKVTCVHKANIMKFSDGLFLSTAAQVARDYPDIAFESIIVDNLCMQLVRSPQQFDILLLPNLYGDIVSDLCAGLVGGLGVAPSANIGEVMAVFEPAHGSAPKYAGQNKVNPTAMILCGALMLRYLGEGEAALRLEAALARVLAKGEAVTYDLKPHREDPTAVGTSQMAEAIIQEMKVHA